MKDWIGKYCIINGSLKPVEDIPGNFRSSEKPVYEVLRVEEGVPLFVEDHFLRLQNSFSLCNKTLSMTFQRFKGTVTKLIGKNNISEGPVKFIFSSANNKQHFIAYFMTPHKPTKEEYETGIKTVSLFEERNNPNAKIWNEVLRETATRLIDKNRAYEAILIDKDNFITEGSRSNIFFIKNNTVYTTPEELILPGITRKKVLEICMEKKVKTEFSRISYNDIDEFESVFLTGTSRKVVPVRSIDNITFDTKNKLLRLIMKYFDDLVADYISKNKSYE